MRILPALLPLMIWSSIAHAGDVGVVVTGDPTIQPQLAAQLEDWLRGHGHQLIVSPLPPEALNKLIDCFVIEDDACAKGVVDKEAKSSAVVFLKVDVETSDGMRDVSITGRWFEKGGEASAERRTCAKCTDPALRTTMDDLMTALAGKGRVEVGQLAVSSTPSGARVSVDGKPAGVTPISIALSPGPHTIELAHDAAGSARTTRTVTITKGQSVPLVVSLAPPMGRSKKLPIAVLAGGGALLLGGIVVLATADGDDGSTYEYRDYKPLGLALGLGGLAAIGVGTWLYLRGGTESAPTVAVVPGGAAVGWAGSF